MVTAEQEHIVDQLRVEVRAGRRELASQVQEQLGFYLHSQAFISDLEGLLDRLVPRDMYLEIPRLDVTMELGGELRFGPLLLKQLEAEIRKKMNSREAGGILLKGEALAEAVRIAFLRYGVQPYTAPSEILTALITRLKTLGIREDKVFETWLMGLALEDPVIWKRVYFITGGAGMRDWLVRLTGTDEPALVATIRSAGGQWLIGDSLAVPDADGWASLMPFVIELLRKNGGLVVDGVLPADIVMSPGDHAGLSGKTVRQGAIKDENIQRALRQGIPVANAGITLLWREYGGLLKRLGWVDELAPDGEGKKRIGFVDETARQRAIWLLDYIVWGEMGDDGSIRDLAESRLLLNKVLCDWPLAEPVDPGCYPSEPALRMVDKELTQWLQDWRKDKVLSVQWLRVAFLQRSGLLAQRTDGSWLLTVEKRTEDVLILRPSLVRLAWMPRLLHVEW